MRIVPIYQLSKNVQKAFVTPARTAHISNQLITQKSLPAISNLRQFTTVPRVIALDGKHLTAEDIVSIAQEKTKVELCKWTSKNVTKSSKYIQNAVAHNETIYGVTTNYGGQAKKAVAPEEAALLQKELLEGLKAGTGEFLSDEIVRGAMALRANTFLKGVSGIRFELAERLVYFLNNNIIPRVRAHGSLGASGDLIPLASIAGSLVGQDTFEVNDNGIIRSASECLKRHGLEPVSLLPKEGLALVNGTAFMTSFASFNVVDYNACMNLMLHIHAFYLQALGANLESFSTFVHDKNKPHTGQVLAAKSMRELFEGSQFIHSRTSDKELTPGQDVYSIRCLPQYLSPYLQDRSLFESTVNIEANAATDNPLFDVDKEMTYQQGNFYGGDIGVRMDQMRSHISMMVRHLDIQMGLLMHDGFNKGLNPSLVSNHEGSIKFGLKGLQISGNALCTEIHQHSSPVTDKTNSHYEQYNQNITSQGFLAASLTHKTLNLTKHYLALALIAGVQAIELKSQSLTASCDPRPLLGNMQKDLYEATYKVLNQTPDPSRPLVDRNIDLQEPLETLIETLSEDLSKRSNSQILSVTETLGKIVFN